MSRSAEVGLATLGGLAVVAVTGSEFLKAAVAIGVLLIASVVVTRFRSLGGAGGLSSDKLASVFAAAWLLLFLGPPHQFNRRAISAAVRAPAFDSVIEVLYMSACGVLAIVAVRAVFRDLWSVSVPLPLFGLPIFATLSFLWSPIYLYSFARGLELVMTALLAWGTASIGASEPRFLRAVLERFARWSIRAIIVLILLGIAFGPVYASGSAENLETRFAWIGSHPLGVAWASGLAVVAVLAVPPSASRLRGVGWIAGLGIVGYAHYAAQGRAALVALGAALGYLLVNAVRKSSIARYVSLPYVLTGVAVAVFYFQDQLLEYFYRGQSSDEVSSGNGRAELWADGFRMLKTPFDWAFGLGYGNSREVFLRPDRLWSKSAHSSVLATLVNLGIIGLALLALWLGYTLIMLFRARLFDSPIGNALVAFLVFSVVHAIAAETVSQPGAGNAIVMLVSASAIAIARSPEGSWEHMPPAPTNARGSPQVPIPDDTR